MERDLVLTAQEMKAGGGGWEGRKRLLGLARGTILTCVDQWFFHTERSCMVHDMHLNFL